MPRFAICFAALCLAGCVDADTVTYELGDVAGDAEVAALVDGSGAELRAVWLAVDEGFTGRDFTRGDWPSGRSAAGRIAGLRDTMAEMRVGHAGAQAFRACHMLEESGGLLSVEPGAAVAMLSEPDASGPGGIYGIRAHGGNGDALEAALRARFQALRSWPSEFMWLRGGWRDVSGDPLPPEDLARSGGVPIDRTLTEGEARATVEAYVAERGLDCAAVLAR